jgi:L-asparaginase II
MIEVTRGQIVECIHFGALAVVDVQGRLVASFGNPNMVTFLRSAAKPFQALPFVERGGPEAYGMTDREVALTCASHSGTDEHYAAVSGLQAKIGVSEHDLMCGTHPAMHQATAARMLCKGEAPTPNRHNCSGKHTGMLAHAVLRHEPKETYLDWNHPVQQSILAAFAEMCGVAVEDVELGVDGCSAPNFAVSLHSAALGYARLADPTNLGSARAAACQRIYRSMTAHPFMVAGPQRFNTRLMEAAGGRILAKSGAEGFMGLALPPGALGSGSPALGIAVKISDGDASGRAISTAVVSALCQLGALSSTEAAALAEYQTRPVYNWRHIEVGEIRPAFTLERGGQN